VNCRRPRCSDPAGFVALFLAAVLAAPAAAPDFAHEVQPLLETHCFKCHGPEKQKGGLRFDTKEGAFAEPDSGESAIVRGHASQSRLIQLVSSRDEDEWMPPKGERLAPAQVDLLKRWIDAGADWPEAAGSTGPRTRTEMIVTDEDRKHWSFLPLHSPSLPALKTTAAVRTPVDRFIVARLEEKKLALSPAAAARILARRIYFDLVGLPPTPTQIDEFAAAHARDPRAAVAALVDELLASPHHGERWARHWLDVTRYADSDGSESDADRPTAYHFRDFVIRALNEDMPFDRFVRWQLAGDELEPENPHAIAATGFIVAGTHAAIPANLMEEERIRERFNELDDMIATTGSAMLGLTLACARCHDHKYDPVPARDYYRLQNAFNAGNRAQVPLTPLDEAQRYRAVTAQWTAEHDTAKQRLDDHLKAMRKTHEPAARLAKIEALKISDEEKARLKHEPESPPAKELARKFSRDLRVLDKDLRPFLTDTERTEWDQRAETLKAAEARKPKGVPTAYAFADDSAKPRETFLLARGDFNSRTEPVELGFLAALTRGKAPADY